MDFQGVYTLATVNGDTLPVAAPAAGASSVRSGSLTLNYGGSFVSVLTYAGPDGTATHREASGSYTVVPAQEPPGRFESAKPLRIDLQWNGAGTTSASLDGRTLTVEREGVRYTYRYTSAPGK